MLVDLPWVGSWLPAGAWPMCGDDLTSITKGRAHSQVGTGIPSTLCDLPRVPQAARGWSGVPLVTGCARRHRQEVQQTNVCVTSLLDHLDTKSLPQRDMSLSPLSGNVDSKSILIEHIIQF